MRCILHFAVSTLIGICLTSQSSAQWQPMMDGFDGNVHALVVFEGNLIAGGQFVQSGNQIVNRVARWNGSSWEPMHTGMNGPVYALAVHNGVLVAGGDFTNASGSAALRIASWNGVFWQPMDPSTLPVCRALTVFNGELYAGCDTGAIHKWTGSAWPQVSQLPDRVNALIVFEGELIAGGQFLDIGGTGSGVSRWNGNAWQSLGGGMSGSSWWVYDLTVFNGELIAGGSFTFAGGQNANRIARWNGTTWQPLGIGMENTVYALASDAIHLYVGGDFTIAGGPGTNRVARWNGSAWQMMGSGMNATVRTLAFFDGDIVAGGDFATADGQPVSRIARWPLTTIGSCCLTDSTCIETDEATCTGQGGTFNGIGTTCGEVNCVSVCESDIAPPGGDGTVGVPDLLKIINDWGACP